MGKNMGRYFRISVLTKSFRLIAFVTADVCAYCREDWFKKNAIVSVVMEMIYYFEF